MEPGRLAARLLVASFAIIVPLAFLAARGLEPEVSVRARIGSILATLPALDQCWTRCTTDGCTGQDHRNYWGVGSDDGPVHTCGSNEGGCAWHREQCTKQEGPPIGQLQKLIPSLDGDGIRYFLESTEALTLNTDRRAIQLLGCDGEVILSVNLTPTQELELAIDE